MLCYRMFSFTHMRRMLKHARNKTVDNTWLCSSRVERATHNRLVTGSNPVGANILFSRKILITGLSIALIQAVLQASPAQAQSQDILRPTLPLSGTSSTESSSSQQPSTLNSGPSSPAADMPASQPYRVGSPYSTLNNQSDSSLRPAMNATSAPSASGGSGPGASWPPYDTLPLGVNQFQAGDQTVQGKGAVGCVVKVVNEFTQNKPCKNCVGVRVKIQNQSANALILDGERAQAIKSGAALKSLSEDDAMHLSGYKFSEKQKKLLAATFVGTLGFWEPILQDKFSTSKTDFPISYGLNENRRRLEDRRLSRRIILPGEDTEGVIYFPGETISFDTISIPILTFPVGVPNGTLQIAANAPQITTPNIGSPPGPNATPNSPLINRPYNPNIELQQRKRLREE